MILQFNIHTLWHAGTGRGDGPERDSLVIRSEDGLPVLPARTIAGLCREASMVAEAAGMLTGPVTNDSGATYQRTQELFGEWNNDKSTDRPDQSGMGRFSTAAGVLDFRTARLGKTPEEQRGWEEWAHNNSSIVAHAFSTIKSTSISSVTGTAQSHTLRTTEVTVPINLYSYVTLMGDSVRAGDWLRDLNTMLPLVRSLGRNRNRGFGRVTVKALDQQHG